MCDLLFFLTHHTHTHTHTNTMQQISKGDPWYAREDVSIMSVNSVHHAFFGYGIDPGASDIPKFIQVIHDWFDHFENVKH